MLAPRFVVWMLSIGTMTSGSNLVCGQNFPNKPIRVVTDAPGGSADFVTRLIAQGLTDGFGQQVIVDNRAGSVNIQATAVVKAQPDGYTLLVTGSSFWIAPLLQDVPFDPVRDFLPVSLTNMAPSVLVVTPSLPINSVSELIALAKAKPGALNYASGSTGSSNHLAAELFKSSAGVNIVQIAYKSTAAALNEVLGGQVQLMFATAASVAPHLKSGRLKAVAVTSAQPSAMFPGVPTVAAAVPGYQSVSIYAIFAPAGTPTNVIARLNQEIVRVVNRADVKEKFFNAGVEAVGSSPEALAVAMKSEMTRLGKVIKDAGIRVE